MTWVEVRHSDFLACLLDPKQNHGISDVFLKGLLQSALRGEANQTVTPHRDRRMESEHGKSLPRVVKHRHFCA